MAKELELGEHHNNNARSVGLPPRPFLYTVDQISVLLELSEASLRSSYIYYVGRSIGHNNPDLMTARNIAKPGEHPDWRITERELVRWMRRRGFRYYERSSLR